MVFFKRGALAPDQIALLILAVVGFALAAMFLFGVFENKELSERELCRLSILSKTTISGVVQTNTPLNCFTEKICLTPKKNFLNKLGDSEKSSCKQFAGETNIREVEVGIDDNPVHQKESANIIQREVANAMFDCWAMTGQGKMDIWGTGGGIDLKGGVSGIFKTLGLTTGTIAPHCLVCSRVAFSDDFFEGKDIENKNAVLSRMDFNSFFSREKVPGSSLTYLQTFTDESVGSGLMNNPVFKDNVFTKAYGRKDLTDGEIDEIKKYLRTDAEKIKDEDIKKNTLEELDESTNQEIISYFDSRPLPIDSKQIAIVFTQIKVSNVDPNDVFWLTAGKGAIAGVGLAGTTNSVVSLMPFGKIAKVITEIVAAGAIITSMSFKAKMVTQENQAVSALSCGSLQSSNKEDNVQGCSFVKLMDWSANNLNTLCSGGIEGNI